MKKILMGFFLLLCVFSMEKANALNYNLTLEAQQGIYFYREGDTIPPQTGQYSLYKLSGILAYCIDPSHEITTLSYVNTDILSYSEEIKEKIALIGYYGREYPGHDNVRYSMATQALIWELLGAGKVTFWTGYNKTGSEIDVTEERNIIMNLVNNHFKIPDIPLDLYGYYNDGLIIENEALKNFYISDYNGNTDSQLDSGKLTVRSRVIGDSYITLTLKPYDSNETIIFVGNGVNNTQKLARLRVNKFLSFNVNTHLKGIKIRIIKKDENKNILERAGIKFKIKDLSTGNYLCENIDCIFETNDKGYVLTDGVDFGKYEVEEVEEQIIEGYLWNSEKKTIQIKPEGIIYYNEELGHFVSVSFSNKAVNGILKLHKQREEVNFLNEINYSLKDYFNVEFMIYDINDNYIDTVKTDENGEALYSGLKVGKYYLKENNSSSDYILEDKIYFDIKQENQYNSDVTTNIEIVNKLKKGTLEFTKSDLVTNEGIPNTIIEIYNENDECLLTRKTDNNGKIIIEKLPIGKYYIVEKEANSMYKITNEKVFFEISENDELVNASMTNEKKEVIVPKTSKDDKIINQIFLLSGLFSLGGMYYERKRTI